MHLFSYGWFGEGGVVFVLVWGCLGVCFFFSPPSFSQAAIGRVVQIPEVFSFSFLHGWWHRKDARATCKVENSQSSVVLSLVLVFLFSVWIYGRKLLISAERPFQCSLDVRLASSITDCVTSCLPAPQCCTNSSSSCPRLPGSTWCPQ